MTILTITPELSELLDSIYAYSASGDGSNGIPPSIEDLGMYFDRVLEGDGSPTEQGYLSILLARSNLADPQKDGGAERLIEQVQKLVDRANLELNGLFYEDRDFNESYVSDWDVSGVTNFRDMFNVATSFDQDISQWDVSGATITSFMFAHARSFNQDIGDWDVSNVKTMRAMFHDADSFNQDLGEWDVGNVKDMRSMFRGTETFDQDIGDWNVGNVRLMSDMFNNAKVFDQDIGYWDISSLEDAKNMLNNSGLSSENFDNLLAGWSSLGENETRIGEDVILGAKGLVYTDATSHLVLTLGYNWSIEGATLANDVVVGDQDPSSLDDILDLRGADSGRIIHGIIGDDIIYGSLFDDEIVGGFGHDIMAGGAGDDTYVFRNYVNTSGVFGHDIIRGFVAGEGTDDVLEFGNFTMSDLTISQVGNSTLIEAGVDNSILLQFVQMDDLHQDDFIFV